MAVTLLFKLKTRYTISVGPRNGPENHSMTPSTLNSEPEARRLARKQEKQNANRELLALLDKPFFDPEKLQAALNKRADVTLLNHAALGYALSTGSEDCLSIILAKYKELPSTHHKGWVLCAIESGNPNILTKILNFSPQTELNDLNFSQAEWLAAINLPELTILKQMATLKNEYRTPIAVLTTKTDPSDISMPEKLDWLLSQAVQRQEYPPNLSEVLWERTAAMTTPDYNSVVTYFMLKNNQETQLNELLAGDKPASKTIAERGYALAKERVFREQTAEIRQTLNSGSQRSSKPHP